MRACALVVLAACSPSRSPSLGAVDGIAVTAAGYDAYRYLEALPRIRIGDRAYMRSTYDRTGGNEGADASHFVREADDGTYVTVDVAGTGYLAFARANHWHGSPWHYTVDGTEHVVRETSTATPDSPVTDSTFLPEEAFPSPLAVTWATTRGADLSWVNVPFASSLVLAHGRTHYGTGYYIYHLFPRDIDTLSTPLRVWQEEPPPSDVLQLLTSDVVADGDEHSVTVDVPAASAVPALYLDGPAMIRRIELDAPVAIGGARLVIYWDGREQPSVDAPIALLFGAGTFYDREHRGDIVKALLARVSIDGDRVHASLSFPMPFASSARIEIVGATEDVPAVKLAVRTVADATPPSWQGYFHATYVDHGVPTLGEDLVVLDTTVVEGGGEWCGTFNGMSFTFSDRADLGTLEGDPRMFFDDAMSPQGHGTGTEEWAGGGDYWGGQLMTLPLAGHPTGAPSPAAVIDAVDAIEGAYRFLIADAMPFGKNARIQLEHGAVNNSLEHYRTVAYWYGRPSPCLVLTDTIDVGDPSDEAKHAYASTGTVTTLSSSWDGYGVSSPIMTDTGRTTTGDISFTASLEPRNRGVLLRRNLDYGLPDQRADVFVDDVPVGTWYLAGSSTCVYSNPPGELDPGQQIAQVSPRQWRDDELLIPRAVTKGKSSIRIRLHVTSAPRALYPGAMPGAAAWSEYGYRVYSYVL